MRVLEAIGSILDSVDRSTDPDELLERSLEAVLATLRSGVGLVGTLDGVAHRGPLALVHSRGWSDAELLAFREAPLEGGRLLDLLAQGEAAVVARPAESLPALTALPHLPERMLLVPLVSGRRTVGLLAVGLPPGHRQAADDRSLFTHVGHQLGAALERARLVDELRRSEERYHDLFHHANDIIYVHDLDLSVIAVNQAGLDLTGYSRADVEEMSILDIVAPEDRERVRDLTLRLLRGEATAPFEVQVLRKDGERALLEVNPRVFREGRRLRGVHGVARDITRRRSLEAEVDRTRSFLERIVSNALVAVVVVDRAGVIQVFNRGAELVTGYTADEMLGRDVRDFPLTRDEVGGLRRQLIARGLLESFETRVLRRDGVEVPILAFLSLPRDDRGQIDGVVAIFVDNTEKLRLERELVRAEKLKAFGAMASGVAHDFNNVLSTVLGNAQMLLRQVGDPEVRHRLGVIEQAALTGAETVKRVLDFTRERSEQELSPADPNRIVLDAIELGRHRWENLGPEQPIRLHLRMVKAPPVRANAHELKEVLVNLLFNAVDALPGGGRIEVATAVEGGAVSVTVRDDGVGMDEGTRERIFDPFFTTKGEESTGLGLSVSYGIVRRHEGTLEVESGPGEGARFVIRLPADAGEGPARPSLAEPGETSPLRILVIDDEEGLREIMGDFLEQEGHRVVTAASGPEGLEAFRAEGFDVVITDVTMPRMTGLQVARELRDLGSDAVCILTSGWSEEATARGVEEGVADFVLRKPFELSQLGASVVRAQEIRRRRTEPGPEPLH